MKIQRYKKYKNIKIQKHKNTIPRSQARWTRRRHLTIYTKALNTQYNNTKIQKYKIQIQGVKPDEPEEDISSEARPENCFSSCSHCHRLRPLQHRQVIVVDLMVMVHLMMIMRSTMKIKGHVLGEIRCKGLFI